MVNEKYVFNNVNNVFFVCMTCSMSVQGIV